MNDNLEGEVCSTKRSESRQKTGLSVLATGIAGVILIGAGLGIGIGAGIWKGSSASDNAVAPEMFFSQQADGVLLKRASPESDEIFVSMRGVDGLATAMASRPGLSAGFLAQDTLVSILNDEPGKNAILICDESDNKVALPLSIDWGTRAGSKVGYRARMVPFNNGTWDRIDEGRMLNASTLLSSFVAGEEVEFDGSCYMFIDGIVGDAWDWVKDTAGKIGSAVKDQAESFANDVKEGNIKNLADYASGALGGGAADLTDLAKAAAAQTPEQMQEAADSLKRKVAGQLTTAAVAGAALGGAALAGAGAAGAGGVAAADIGAVIGEEAILGPGETLVDGVIYKPVSSAMIPV